MPLTFYFNLYALSGQVTDIPGGRLAFAPAYPPPFRLPLLLAGTTGALVARVGPAAAAPEDADEDADAVEDDAPEVAVAVTYTVEIAFGRLRLPAGGLSVSGHAYPHAVDLAGGQRLSWTVPRLALGPL